MVKLDRRNTLRREKYSKKKQNNQRVTEIKNKLDQLEKTRNRKANSRKKQKTHHYTATYVLTNDKTFDLVENHISLNTDYDSRCVFVY